MPGRGLSPAPNKWPRRNQGSNPFRTGSRAQRGFPQSVESEGRSEDRVWRVEGRCLSSSNSSLQSSASLSSDWPRRNQGSNPFSHGVRRMRRRPRRVWKVSAGDDGCGEKWIGSVSPSSSISPHQSPISLSSDWPRRNQGSNPFRRWEGRCRMAHSAVARDVEMFSTLCRASRASIVSPAIFICGRVYRRPP